MREPLLANHCTIILVNIDYEPFDASGWEIRDAGLLWPVRVRGY